MHIAIASGKGGTGKTTISVNLAAHLCRSGLPVTLLDCDVEEPNAHIYLTPDWDWTRDATVPVPAINAEACLGESCRACIEQCRFKALIWMGEVMPFPELCHGCGLCMEACPAGAIGESGRVTGTISSGSIPQPGGTPLSLVSGSMRIGEAMSPPLIRALLETAQDKPDALVLRDCPPGTSCPVITSLEGADYTVLVTESTPFGLHDLRLAVETLRKLDQPFGVVINRHGLGDDRVETWLREQSIPVLARFEHSLAAATACAAGTLLVDALPSMAPAFTELWNAIVDATGYKATGADHA